MSWFERHLNWSWVIALFGSALAGQIVGVVAWLIIPELPEDIVGGLIGIIRFVISFSASLWVLAMKGRKVWWVFLPLAPVCLDNLRQEEKGVVQTTDQVQEMNNATEYDIRQQCLAYYQEELRFKAFQEKEADLYNEAVVKYGMSVGTDDRAAKEMLRATKRLVESANEILRRRSQMAGVPDMASATYFAWQTTYSDYLAWASAQAAAVSAVANGMVPHGKRVQELLEESEKSRRKAEGEEKRFLKRLKLRSNEAGNMLM